MPSGSTGSNGAPMGQLGLIQTTWPTRTAEHVDLWLHSYALLNADTTLVPYFRRGYRDRMLTLRKQRGVNSLLDANRSQLLARIAVQPSIGTGGQFLPLYFESWSQMRQAIDLFIRANGNPNAASDQQTATYIAILASTFPTVQDREWLRLFAESVTDESTKFYHDYWTTERARRTLVTQHVDSTWQLKWRPSLQRFLNNTQQQAGELYLSMPIGGEGRTIQYGKTQNAIAVAYPENIDETDYVLYTTVHEIAGSIANVAIVDNTTPADRRSGVTSQYEQSAAVRAGALLLEKTIPASLPGYMRFYLQQAGKTAPNDPRAAFTAAYAIPNGIRDAISRQIDSVLGGI